MAISALLMTRLNLYIYKAVRRFICETKCICKNGLPVANPLKKLFECECQQPGDETPVCWMRM
jgi:hypothetical protein